MLLTLLSNDFALDDRGAQKFAPEALNFQRRDWQVDLPPLSNESPFQLCALGSPT